MFLGPLQLTEQQVEEKQNELATILLDGDKVQEVRKELQAFFADNPIEKISKHYWTYWRWYVRLTWDSVNSIEPEELVVAMGHQIPMATILGFNVLKDYLNYLLVNCYTQREKISVYADTRAAVRQSMVIVGNSQGNSVKMKDLIGEIDLNNRKEATSLETAELLSKIKQVVFSDKEGNHAKYGADTVDVAVTRFMSTINFFLGVEPEKIPDIVELFDEQRGIADSQQGGTPESADEVERLDYLSVRAKVEELYGKSLEAQNNNINEILDFLGQLADQYQDENLRSLYYFNEQTGMFEWNEELLKQ